ARPPRRRGRPAVIRLTDPTSSCFCTPPCDSWSHHARFVTAPRSRPAAAPGARRTPPMTPTARYLALLLIACLALGAAPATAQDVRIGTIFPTTGNMAFGGNEGFTGTEIAREIVNERGGIWGGKQIVFVTADAPDQTAATTEMNG